MPRSRQVFCGLTCWEPYWQPSRLKDEGVDAELLLFEGEQHGLRRSENIEQALLAELTFFQRYL